MTVFSTLPDKAVGFENVCEIIWWVREQRPIAFFAARMIT